MEIDALAMDYNEDGTPRLLIRLKPICDEFVTVTVTRDPDALMSEDRCAY